MARPSGQDFPEHKGGLFGNFGIPSLSGFPKFPKFPKSPPLCFGKSCPLGRAILEILEISEILEILEIGKLGARIFGNFGIEFGKADRHPSDDRPCTTTQLRGHGLSTGGGRPYIYIYTYIYMCIYTHIVGFRV